MHGGWAGGGHRTIVSILFVPNGAKSKLKTSMRAIIIVAVVVADTSAVNSQKPLFIVKAIGVFLDSHEISCKSYR